MAGDIGRSIIATGVAIVAAFVAESHQVQDRGAKHFVLPRPRGKARAGKGDPGGWAVHGGTESTALRRFELAFQIGKLPPPALDVVDHGLPGFFFIL